MSASSGDAPGMERCPLCARPITAGARQCPHCSAVLGLESPNVWSRKTAAFWSVVLPGAGHIYKVHVGVGLLWLIVTMGGYLVNVLLGLLLHVLCLIHAVSGDPTRR